MKRRIYGKRALLNLPGHESTAAIVAEISGPNDWGWETKLTISDCSRTVCFCLADPAEKDTTDERFENDMHKLDTIIESVRELQKGMRRVRRMRGR